MSNWYTTLEQFKAAVGIYGSDMDTIVGKKIAAASRTIDDQFRRRFIPKLQTRYYPWPQRSQDSKQHLWLDEDLLSVTTLKTANGTVTIDVSDYFLEPVNTGPPYRLIEIDLGDNVAADAAFGSDDSAQRAVSVEGQWGYGNDTEAAGTVASGLAADAAVTTFVCSDGSLIDVGHALLIEDEQLFVSGRATVDTACNTNGALTADASETTVTVTDGTKVKAGEVILINAERCYVESVTGNDLSVKRGYDGTALAAHDDAQDVYAFRTLTVVRGVNGTTAAKHDDAKAIVKYAPPEPIQALCLALAIFNYEQDRGGRTGIVGTDEMGIRVNPRSLASAWEQASSYREPVIA